MFPCGVNIRLVVAPTVHNVASLMYRLIKAIDFVGKKEMIVGLILNEIPTLEEIVTVIFT